MPSMRRDYARIIGESGHHLLEVVNDLLDISKIESGNFDFTATRFDMAVLAPSPQQHRTDAPQPREARNVALDLDIPPGSTRASPPITARLPADPDPNLLSNAVKFTPDGGPRLPRACVPMRGACALRRLRYGHRRPRTGSRTTGAIPSSRPAAVMAAPITNRAHEGTGPASRWCVASSACITAASPSRAVRMPARWSAFDFPLIAVRRRAKKRRAPIPIHIAARQRERPDATR